MNKNNDVKARIRTDEDFINYPKFSNSLKKLMAKYPDGIEDDVIAKALMITREEVVSRYNRYIQTAREQLGVSDGD